MVKSARPRCPSSIASDVECGEVTDLPRTTNWVHGWSGLHVSALVAVVAVAVVARFWGLLYGLPHSYYPDESTVVDDAREMARTGDPRPSQLLWPTFWIYVVAIALRLGRLTSSIPGGLGPLGEPSLDNMVYVYGVSRSVTALAGVLTVIGLYAVAARWLAQLRIDGSRWYALLAAALLALSPLHVQHSHVTSPDVPATAFLVLSALFTLQILESGALRSYVLGAVALGLASATKYPSAMFALAIVVAHLASSGSSARRPLTVIEALVDRRLLLAGVLTVAIFFAASPYILIDWHRFADDFLPQAIRALQRGSVGEIGLSGPNASLAYGLRVIEWGTDTPVALLAAIGLVIATLIGVCRPPRERSVVWALATMLAFPLLMYVFSWTWQPRFARYLLALIPFACLLAAFGLAGLSRMVTGRLSVRAEAGLAVAIGLATLFWQADGVVRYDLLLTRPDTRTITARWLADNLPPGEQVIVEWYGPPHQSIRQVGFDLSDRPLDRYLGRSPRYIVTSSFTYDRWLRMPAQYPNRAAFYTGLHEQATLLFEVRPWPELEYDPVQEGWDGWHDIPLTADARPGPVLSVYQVTP
jgi:4-amino-4-deoxy-L-arabinose transferase-like glycosyltransferase